MGRGISYPGLALSAGQGRSSLGLGLALLLQLSLPCSPASINVSSTLAATSTPKYPHLRHPSHFLDEYKIPPATYRRARRQELEDKSKDKDMDVATVQRTVWA